MATTFTLYNSFLKYAFDGSIDLCSDTIKVALVTSSYTPAVTHDVLAEVLASPSPEVVAIASPSNGYTAGGATLSGGAVTLADSPLLCTFDASDLSWLNLTATFRYGVMYAAKSVGSPAVVNPLIGYILFNDAPADITVVAVDFSIKWSASGILTAGRAA